MFLPGYLPFGNKALRVFPAEDAENPRLDLTDLTIEVRRRLLALL